MSADNSNVKYIYLTCYIHNKGQRSVGSAGLT